MSSGWLDTKWYFSGLLLATFEHFNIEFHSSRCVYVSVTFETQSKINFRQCFYQQPFFTVVRKCVGCLVPLSPLALSLRTSLAQSSQRRKEHSHSLVAPASGCHLCIALAACVVVLTFASAIGWRRWRRQRRMIGACSANSNLNYQSKTGYTHNTHTYETAHFQNECAPRYD